MIPHHPPKLSPPCILLQIKLTDVLVSSVCLNSQELKGIKEKHIIITICSTTLGGTWPPQKTASKVRQNILCNN
jgi:hypothetical protein